jgi:aryl-alcohol dehydrogenase-like predicted oxidoreductase
LQEICVAAIPYTSLGQSGLKTPPLWLGTMMFGDQTPMDEARRMIESCREAGVYAVDTADNYAAGASERMLGQLIAADRERWIVASKVANPMGDQPNDRGLSRRWVMRELDNSLRRLGTDWIDVYYMHRDDESTPIEEVLSTFARLIESGKIRYYGLSNFRGWRVARLVETARRMGVPPPIVCQPPYSELLPCCDHYGVGVVVYSPLARGVLTGKYKPGQAPAADSRAARGDKRILQTEFRPESLAMSQAFEAHARSRGMTATQLAIAWVLNNRLVHGVIGGPKTLAQWQDYLAALQCRLTSEDEAAIDALVPPGYATTHGYNDPQYPLTGRVPR